MNRNLLKGKMRELQITQRELSAKTGMSLPTFNAKINGHNGREFTLSEIKLIQKNLRLTTREVEAIFLS